LRDWPDRSTVRSSRITRATLDRAAEQCRPPDREGDLRFMKPAAMVAIMLARLAFVIQLVLGIIIWAGNSDSLTGLHILIGLVFVLALWALAVIALPGGVAYPLVAAGLVWGIVVVAFGLAQRGLIPGDAHWVIRVIHLLIGLVAIGLAEMLSARIRRAKPA